MTLLLTGYEPFGDHETNPSAAVARGLDGEDVAGHRVVGRVLPVEFDAAGEELASLVESHEPAALLSTGLAAGRTAVSVERVGINVDDCAGTADNAGAEPRGERIEPDGPDARFATIPVGAVVDALLADGVPARLSNTAGTHLCNHALYRGRALVERAGREAPVGFLHLPCTPEQAAAKARDGEAGHSGSVRPSLPKSLARRAVVRAFETTLATG